MADVNPKVMDMVEAALKKNPDVSNKELFEKAKAVDKDVGKLNARQFNARYPLQVKRAIAPKKTTKRAARKPAKQATKRAGAGRKAAASAPGQDRVRTVLLDLARDVANAQGKGDVVDVIAGIDRYVDRVRKAAG